ncbi:MAG: hypothetical protein NTZ87_00360 [Candidatus Nomurabacteria bacterium]|nr:hypothetical protein [Candidatus Nomurabacteria bacterium]
MTWALKRQILYIVILILFFAICGFLIAYPSLNKAPTCFDGKQNGTETGMDCGGSCALQCLAQMDPVSVLWARAFRVVPGRYNAIAYLENHNKNTAINKINYRFRFADENNIYIAKREGSTYVPPSGKFAVFEPAIDVGNSIPVYTTFEFTQTPQWVTIPQEKIDQLKVSVSNINLVNEDISPALSATIKNDSLFTVRNINVVAILYDASHNAVSGSSTYLDSLFGGENKNVNFTWPEKMPSKIVTKEIIPLYNIFFVKLK